jgi:hypothetical protein
MRRFALLFLLMVLMVPAIYAQSDSTTDEGRVFIRDDFSTRAYRWALTQTSKGLVAYQKGQLAFRIASPHFSLASSPDTDLVLSRYRFRLTVSLSIGDPAGVVGVLWNRQGESDYYLLELSAAGSASVWRVEGQRRTPLLAATPFVLAPRYVVEVLVYEGEFKVTLNGVALPALSDGVLRRGMIGLYARAGDVPLEAFFDDVLVTDITTD